MRRRRSGISSEGGQGMDRGALRAGSMMGCEDVGGARMRDTLWLHVVVFVGLDWNDADVC